jgi:hypothetical protein
MFSYPLRRCYYIGYVCTQRRTDKHGEYNMRAHVVQKRVKLCLGLFSLFDMLWPEEYTTISNTFDFWTCDFQVQIFLRFITVSMAMCKTDETRNSLIQRGAFSWDLTATPQLLVSQRTQHSTDTINIYTTSCVIWINIPTQTTDRHQTIG